MYGGVLLALEQSGILKNISCFVGSSIGALTAGLLAVSYSAQDILEVILSHDYRDLKPNWDYTKQLSNIYYRHGRHNTKTMEEFVRMLLKKYYELEMTFQQLFDFVGSTLMVSVCCVNSGHTEYLSRLTVPDMCIGHAICMSMCVPFEFEPYKMDDMLYCDGSVFGHSLPQEIPDHKSFELDLDVNDCLALYLKSTYDLKIIQSGQAYASCLLNGAYMALHMKPRFRNCITLTCDVDLLADTVPKKNKELYITAGFNITKEWLRLNKTPR